MRLDHIPIEYNEDGDEMALIYAPDDSDDCIRRAPTPVNPAARATTEENSRSALADQRGKERQQSAIKERKDAYEKATRLPPARRPAPLRFAVGDVVECLVGPYTGPLFSSTLHTRSVELCH